MKRHRRSFRYLVSTCGCMWATLLPGQVPQTKPQKPPSTLEMYQACFQKMIDLGETDNRFMRKCLGIRELTKHQNNPSGYLQIREIEKAVKSRLPFLVRCYRSWIERGKQHGIQPEGILSVTFAITPKGTIKSLKYTDHQITDVQYLDCAKTALVALKFRTTRESTPLIVQYQFDLKLIGNRPTVLISPEYPKLQGQPGLNDEELLEVFRSNAPNLRRCYDQLLKRNPKRQGKIQFTITVGGTGKVKAVEYKALTIKNKPFRRCLAQKIESWTFPPPRYGQEFIAPYPPIIFRPN